jgi:hypothetical protein
MMHCLGLQACHLVANIPLQWILCCVEKQQNTMCATPAHTSYSGFWSPNFQSNFSLRYVSVNQVFFHVLHLLLNHCFSKNQTSPDLAMVIESACLLISLNDYIGPPNFVHY